MFVGLISWPASAVARAPSRHGQRDASGGVLPGVTVEASSPALIEKVRAVTTDGAGRYKVVGPAALALHHHVHLDRLSIAQEGTGHMNLPGEFTATIDVTLKVGSLEETMVVDRYRVTVVRCTRSAAEAQGVNRDMLKIPTGKSISRQ